jgi:hypothetical protein
MSETNEQTESFGRTRDLEDAGYTPLKFHGDTEAPATDGAELTEREAKDHIRSWPEPDPVILKTEFHDKDGEKVAFEDAKTAAEALIRARARHAEENIAPKQAEQDEDIGRRIDALRQDNTTAQLPDTARQAEEARTQAAKQHQELLERIANSHERALVAQQEQQIATMENDVRAYGAAVVANLVEEYPEFRGCDTREKVLHVVAAQEAKNPQRARAMVDRLKGIDAISRQWNAVQQAKAQHVNNEFTHWSKQQDAAFRAKHGNDANYQEIATGVRDVLSQFGISAEEYRALATRPEGAFIRDARVQSLLYELSKQVINDKARAKARDLAAKRVPPNVPPVVQPGASLGNHRALSGAANTSHLNKQLSRGGDAALRAAAQMLADRRRNSR